MRHIIYLILFFSSPHISFAQVDDSLKSACIPNTPESSSWPVGGDYYGGLHMASGQDVNGFRKLDKTNRAAIEKYAIEHKIRFAAPISKNIHPGSKKHPYMKGMQSWGGVEFNDAKQLANQACGNAPRTKRQLVIGFSSGGYLVRNAVTKKSCENLGDTTFVAIGAEGASTESHCGKFKNIPPHVFPGEFKIADEFKKTFTQQNQVASIESNRQIINSSR